MKYQVFMTKWNKFRDAVNCGVNYTHSETHIIQGEKKQISRLSPHPTRLFYFIMGQQTAIFFSRNAWKIAFQFCVALLPP